MVILRHNCSIYLVWNKFVSTLNIIYNKVRKIPNSTLKKYVYVIGVISFHNIPYLSHVLWIWYFHNNFTYVRKRNRKRNNRITISLIIFKLTQGNLNNGTWERLMIPLYGRSTSYDTLYSASGYERFVSSPQHGLAKRQQPKNRLLAVAAQNIIKTSARCEH